MSSRQEVAMTPETKKLVAIILAAGAVAVVLIGAFVEPVRTYALEAARMLLGGIQGVTQ